MAHGAYLLVAGFSDEHASYVHSTPLHLSLQMNQAVKGVEKGLQRAAGMPVEVMSLLHTTINPSDPHTIVVLDAFELPVEGSETQVVANSPEVINHMIKLADNLEHVRRGRGGCT